MHLRALIVGIFTLFVLLLAAPKLTTNSHQAQSLPTQALLDASPLPILIGTPDPARISTDQTDDARPDMAQEALVLINASRTAIGCPALVENALLTQVALAHSIDMTTHGARIRHENSSGLDPGTRIRNAGYDWNWYAENIAAGYTTAEEVVNAWLASEGHYRNIYNCSLRDIGIGVYYLQGSPYGLYWTTDFGLRDEQASLPTATYTLTPAPSPTPTHTMTPGPVETLYPDPSASPTAEPTPIEIPGPFKYLLPAVQGHVEVTGQ